MFDLEEFFTCLHNFLWRVFVAFELLGICDCNRCMVSRRGEGGRRSLSPAAPPSPSRLRRARRGLGDCGGGGAEGDGRMVGGGRKGGGAARERCRRSQTHSATAVQIGRGWGGGMSSREPLRAGSPRTFCRLEAYTTIGDACTTGGVGSGKRGGMQRVANPLSIFNGETTI